MILKAIDLGLMSEHLTTHKGVLNKLQLYYCTVRNPALKEIIFEQLMIMRNHVQIMLMLLDPKINERVSVTALQQIEVVEIPCQQQFSIHIGEKEIAIEAHQTAMSMASDNFASALRMKAQNVRDIHVHMALQQVKIQEKYSEVMKSNGWEQAPDSSFEEQIKTLQMFKNLFHVQTR